MRNQGIKEFDGKEFLARKTGKENKELTSLKIPFFIFLGRKKGLNDQTIDDLCFEKSYYLKEHFYK